MKKNAFGYQRTKDDFYRMELDVARDRVGPMNRFLLDKACKVYFSTSKGAAYAYKELTKKEKVV